MANVIFRSGSLAQYVMADKSDNALYFIEDAGQLFKGEKLIADATSGYVEFVSAKPSVSSAVEGKLYIHIAADGVYIYAKKGSSIVEISTEALEEIDTDTTFTNATGAIQVGDGESAILTGVAHDPTWNAGQLTLTIPVYGGDPIKVAIPKDKFVTAGSYNNQTKNIELTIDGQSEKVLIPAEALVNIYEADNDGHNAKVTVTDDNKISADITIDPTSGNALVYTNGKGFMVDISGKIDKIASAAGDKIATTKADGGIAESGVAIKSSGTMGNSNTDIPTAKLIAAAISSAVNAIKLTIDGTANNFVSIGTGGSPSDSGYAAGGSTLSSTASDKTLATEAAVADALAWKPIA